MPKLNDVSDEELINKCRAGDGRHQEMLYKRFYGYAMGIGLRYQLNRDDALEVVNDAFIKTFNALGSFKEGGDFKAWFRKIVVNTALDSKRKNLKYSNDVELEDFSQQTTYPSVIDKLSAADIMEMMKTLPHTQHTIFNLYEIDGYSHKEIGKMLNMPESSSRTYLTRAKQTLQKLITKEVIQS